MTTSESGTCERKGSRPENNILLAKLCFNIKSLKRSDAIHIHTNVYVEP